MFKLKILVWFIILTIFGSCSKEVSKKSLIKEKSLELQVEEAYNDGMEALNDGDVLFAAKKFNDVVVLCCREAVTYLFSKKIYNLLY